MALKEESLDGSGAGAFGVFYVFEPQRISAYLLQLAGVTFVLLMRCSVGFLPSNLPSVMLVCVAGPGVTYERVAAMERGARREVTTVLCAMLGTMQQPGD